MFEEIRTAKEKGFNQREFPPLTILYTALYNFAFSPDLSLIELRFLKIISSSTVNMNHWILSRSNDSCQEHCLNFLMRGIR